MASNKMAVPKRKTSKSKRDMRRSHHALKPISVTYDHTGEPTLPHHVSRKGNYKGRKVVESTSTPSTN